MDKYVRKSDVSSFGLESLDTEKIMKNKGNNIDLNYNIKLRQFKQYMASKLYKFDPISANNKNDELLKLLWLSFLFRGVSSEKQKKLYIEYETI